MSDRNDSQQISYFQIKPKIERKVTGQSFEDTLHYFGSFTSIKI